MIDQVTRGPGTEIYGRERELGRLNDLLTATARGTTGLRLSGPAGIGKTTLLDEFVAVASRRGFRILRAAGAPLEIDLRFAAVHELLLPLREIIATLPARERGAIESVMRPGADGRIEDFAVAASLLAVLGAAAEAEPLVLALDDTQWIDDASLSALLFAHRRLTGEPVALVAASRPLGDQHALSLGSLPEMRLEALAPGPARALLEARRRRTALGPVDAAASERILRAAAGLPLALVELAALGDAPRGTSQRKSGAPEGASELLDHLFGRRLAGLGAHAAEAVLVAALEDSDEADAIMRAGELLGISASVWEEAERAGILALGGGRVAFEHPLIREAVLARAAPAALRSAHAALGHAMSQRDDAARSTWHHAAATVGSDDVLAEQLERLAHASPRRHDHLSSARALARAAELSGSSAEQARRRLLAARSARHAGDVVWARSLADTAREASADPVARAGADLVTAHIEAWRGSSTTAFQQFMGVASAVEAHDPEVAADALGFAAAVAIVGGDLAAALDASTRASAIDRELLSEAGANAVRESHGFVLALLGRTAAARPLLEAVVAWYEAQPQRSGVEYVAEALMWLGDLDRVRRLLDEVEAEARRSGAIALLIQTLILRADLGYRSGGWARAVIDAHEAMSLARDADQPILAAYALAMSAVLEAATGATSSAEGRAAGARELAQRHDLRVVDEAAAFALGLSEMARGRPDRAVDALAPTAAAIAQTERAEPAVVLWPADLVEALIATGARVQARALLDSLASQAERTGGDWARGVVARYRGMLDGGAAADRWFAEAVMHHERAGMPFELARTRLCAGQWLRREGRRVDARAELRRALETFGMLGARPWAERARRELAGSGERLRGRAELDRDALTPQELQISDLVARGASNREIAGELFLSPKTIETHLTRIYRKLGVRSRSQLTTVMAQGGRPPRPDTDAL